MKTQSNEHILVEWSDKAACYKWLHKKSQVFYKRLYYASNIFVVMVSTITGATNYSIAGDMSEKGFWLTVLMGSLNLVCAMVVTSNIFSKNPEKMETHRNSYLQFTKCQKTISLELASTKCEKNDPDYEYQDFIRKISKKFARIIDQSPPIPNIILKHFEKGFENNDILLKETDICETEEKHTTLLDKRSKNKIEKIIKDAVNVFRKNKNIPKEILENERNKKKILDDEEACLKKSSSEVNISKKIEKILEINDDTEEIELTIIPNNKT